ncbi:hypothetical protein LC087_00885 [Bacillus carboniphilus]|uniref:Uncharacterized protein n=1 Tax=Bacillus carboniphilus TaxID=86663 RepID=A0ABY9JZ14_9BACI|nr:hypothetical protein [Bacillus carboniphilus]WLR42830.1 hypothetical protein LC087_00885 [Bacillus carboniphilus]
MKKVLVLSSVLFLSTTSVAYGVYDQIHQENNYSNRIEEIQKSTQPEKLVSLSSKEFSRVEQKDQKMTITSQEKETQEQDQNVGEAEVQVTEEEKEIIEQGQNTTAGEVQREEKEKQTDKEESDKALIEPTIDDFYELVTTYKGVYKSILTNINENEQHEDLYNRLEGYQSFNDLYVEFESVATQTAVNNLLWGFIETEEGVFVLPACGPMLPDVDLQSDYELTKISDSEFMLKQFINYEESMYTPGTWTITMTRQGDDFILKDYHFE